MKNKWNKIWKRNQVMITALACIIALAGYLNFTGKELKDEALYTNSAQFEEAKEAESSAKADEYIYDISEEDINGTADAGKADKTLADIDSPGGNMSQTADSTNAEGDIQMSDIASLDEDIVPESTDSLAKGADEGENPGEAVFTNTTGIISLDQANIMREQVRAQNKEVLLGIINNAELSEEAKAQAVSSMVEMTQTAQKECDAQILLEAKGFPGAVVSISGGKVDVMIGASELTDAQRAQIEDIVKRKTEIAAENIVISPVGNQ